MDQNHKNNWRAMFERDRQDRAPVSGAMPQASNIPPHQPAPLPAFGYDDGYDPARQGAAPMSSQQVVDEAALALADDIQEYRPWILQRGTRPLMMLHLRRFDAQAGHWLGWQMSYPSLLAVEYIGDRLLSLDFGNRHFAIEGTSLGELARHLQTGSVQTVVEYAQEIWARSSNESAVTKIRSVAR